MVGSLFRPDIRALHTIDTFYREMRRHCLLWLPCFRKKIERKNQSGDDIGVTNRAHRWTGGEDECRSLVCSGRTRLPPPPHARPLLCPDHALTRATALRQYSHADDGRNDARARRDPSDQVTAHGSSWIVRHPSQRALPCRNW